MCPYLNLSKMFLSTLVFIENLCKEERKDEGWIQQYPETPIHDITDGFKRGENGEHAETEPFAIT